ncbi:ArpU family transcriptional regulator [Bacillus pumilus]|uniref:ArpU family transcriptional regulator n=1 Tax=Bacillus pumilus TaxID=1408 RepID=UPI00227F7655|nr:ArpU family transcriptional regulator [Bacillus pumilus]MCY7618655.1 ArpU family transcriptional regulator [Bacillus pumilus]
MGAEQLCLMPGIDEKQVLNALIKELKVYRSLKVKEENLKEQKEHEVTGLFPTLRNQEAIYELTLHQIDRALKNSRDELEYNIIEKKYHTSCLVKDLEVCQEIGLKKEEGYEKFPPLFVRN